MSAKTKVAKLSIFSNISLIFMKLIVGIVSGSVSIISEAIHSSMDLVASCIAFVSVKVSDNPPDARHPYGHGKIENVSGVIEAILIFVAAGWIIFEAVKKLLGESFNLEYICIGSIVMLISGVVNFIVSRRLYKIAVETKSIALEADALHLKTDVYTSLGVSLGLILIYITNIKWLDPVVALFVALLIIYESFVLLKKAFQPLVDTAWSEEEIEELELKLIQLDVNFHDLKTRIAGSHRFIDFHLVVSEKDTVLKAHNYCDFIEKELSKSFDNLIINIHVEPN